MLSIVIPVYNEAESLEPLYRKATNAVLPPSMELAYDGLNIPLS